MSVSIQSLTYLGLHAVPIPSQARRRRPCLTSNDDVKISVLMPQCSASRSQQDEDSGCSSVIYENSSGTQWLNGCYMGLRLRSNALFNTEASHALNQHFHHEDKAISRSDAVEYDASSICEHVVNRHSSFQPSQVESYGISGMVVFDESMFDQLGESTFTQQYGHLVNGFSSGVTSFMDDPFC